MSESACASLSNSSGKKGFNSPEPLSGKGTEKTDLADVTPSLTANSSCKNRKSSRPEADCSRSDCIMSAISLEKSRSPVFAAHIGGKLANYAE